MLHICLAVILFIPSTSYQPQGIDPYKVLGIKRGDNLDAASLKRAYRKAALRWHPDKVKDVDKKTAEKKFIEVAWAYEVLSDPGRKHEFDEPPKPSQSNSGHETAGPTGKRSFSMDEAARVFKEAFGTTSSEYNDLIQHLIRSANGGEKKNWRRHAADIQQAIKKTGSKDFTVETVSEDGSERMKTSQQTTDDGKGTTTKKTTTQHTHTSTNSGPSTLGGNQHHGMLGDPHKQHMSAHEAAMAAHMKAHQEALQRAQLAGGAGQLPGRSEL